MIKSSHFLHTAGIFLPTSSLSASPHPTVTWPHLLSFLVFGSREKLCKHQNILGLQIFFLLFPINHGFIRKRWIKGKEVKRFVEVLIKLLLWNFSSKSATNLDGYFLSLETPGIGWIKTTWRISSYLHLCPNSRAVSWYLMSLLSFLSTGIAVGAPRKWRGCEVRGNKILPGVKCNFTERLKNLFSTWQMCYTA